MEPGTMAEPYDYSPACWEWEPLTDADRRRTQERWEPLIGKYAAGMVMLDWQAGRCAVCGRWADDRLVEDHDHQTGLVRGYLCRSCNTREGMNPTDEYRVWREYRQRNPATMCGTVERYWNSWGGQFAEPAPDIDRWQKNPMTGAGL
jgi:hypothetical protein